MSYVSMGGYASWGMPKLALNLASTSPAVLCQMLYKLFCVVHGDENPFLVKVDSTQLVYELKEEIKAKKQTKFAKFEVDDLTLYHTDIDVSAHGTHVSMAVEKKMKELKANRPLHPLPATAKLSKFYKTEPPDDTIHIVIQLPGPPESE